MGNLFNFTQSEKEIIKEVNEATESLFSPYATKNSQAIRASGKVLDSTDLRTNFAVDIDRIIHCALFNRGTDKTQVFSFYHNDDITRRASHVQLVSRIARIIGKALRLNLDLIEAIAIGHDIGHTPFGHKGEEFLNKLYFKNTQRYFNHNVHSVRILTKIITWADLTFQTLDGILCHNGEKAFTCYEPSNLNSFEELNSLVESCYTDKDKIKHLRPSTLEGCVVRISDIIAYLGKDRQDARKLKMNVGEYKDNLVGTENRKIITNTINNIVKNSLGQKYIKMDQSVLECIEEMRNENYKLIYNSPELSQPYYTAIEPMMEKLYYRFLDDIETRQFKSPIFRHHLNHNVLGPCYRENEDPNGRIVADKNEIVVDFIASMTDDYFVRVFEYLFKDDPLSRQIRYVDYFDDK